MKLYPSNAECCEADETKESSVQPRRVGALGNKVKRAKRIFHRRGDQAWWHWSDQDVAWRGTGPVYPDTE